MKKIKRFLSMVLCAAVVCGLLSVNVQAAPTDSALPNASPNQNISAGSVQKKVSETGFYQRLPRLIDTCKTCGNTLREYIPDDYFGCSYTLSKTEVLSECSFKVGESKENGYKGDPCLEFDYKAVCPGTTTVTLKFYYEFNAPFESGRCTYCGSSVSCPSNYNHYYDIVTFTVTVNQDYTLTYDANGGTGAPAAQTQNSTEKSQKFTVSSTTPTREGCTFLGWGDTSNGDVTYCAGDSITLSYTSPSKTIYAVWKQEQEIKKYTVTYTDGVEGEEVFSDQVYNVQLGTKTPAFDGTPEREGYVFKGWEPKVADTVTADVVYIAVWGEDKNDNGTADDEEDKYTVTYTDGVEGEVIFEDQVYSDLLSGTQTPAFEGTPKREGYVFSGWSPKVAPTVTGNATYTAVWKEDRNNNGIPDDEEEKQHVCINIYRNGNTKDIYKTVNLDSMIKGDKLNIKDLDINKYYSNKNGFEYEGWYNDGGWNNYKDGNPNNTLGDTITINGWTNINAMVTDYETVVVKSVTNGDKDNAETIFTGKALHGSDLMSYLNENVTLEDKPGYTLDKWYNWDWYGHKLNDKATVNGWTNVYVTYTANKYTVVYHGNGGVLTSNPAKDQTTSQFEYDKETALKNKDTFTRDNYVFTGWATTDDGEVKYKGSQKVLNLTAEADGKVHLYAVWKEDRNNNGIADDEEDKYTVTYTDGVDGETVFDDQVYSDLLSGDDTPVFEGTPKREGYVFSEWNPEVATTVTEDATYTAVWKEDRNNNGIADDEEDKYTVTYTDGVDGETVFDDQVYSDLLSGDDTPAFEGTPKREGYKFLGWTPELSDKVTETVVYIATWEKINNNNGEEEPGNNVDDDGEKEPGNNVDDDGEKEPGNNVGDDGEKEPENNVSVDEKDNENNAVVTDNKTNNRDNQDKKEKVKTGDNSQIEIMIGALILSLSGLFLLRRRLKEN